MQMVPASAVVPPTDPAGRIFQAIRGVLDAYVAYFEERGVELPKNESDEVVAFVSDGDVVLDRAMLVAEWAGLRSGAPGSPQERPIGAGTEYALEIAITLVRQGEPPLDTDGVPHPDSREERSTGLLLDAAVLFDGALTMTGRAMEGAPGTFTGAPYRRVEIQTMAPYGPDGLGLRGTTMTVVTDLV